MTHVIALKDIAMINLVYFSVEFYFLTIFCRESICRVAEAAGFKSVTKRKKVGCAMSK